MNTHTTMSMFKITLKALENRTSKEKNPLASHDLGVSPKYSTHSLKES